MAEWPYSVLGYEHVYVCLCNGVTERDIRQAASAGCRSMPELTMRTGCGATCGSCVVMATDLLQEARREEHRCAIEGLPPLSAMSHAA